MDALYEFGDPKWDEWGAALYESYAADNEQRESYNALDTVSVHDYMRSAAYASAAHRLCEEIETAIYENTCPYCNNLQEDMETHLYYCEPMN